MLPKDIFKLHTHIGLDLDETLAETFPGFLENAHKLWLLTNCLTIEDIHNHDIYEVSSHNITLEQVSFIWEKFGEVTSDPRSVPIVPFAREGFQLMKQKNIQLSVITARNDTDPLKKRRTLDWLGYHFPEIGETDISFVNHYHRDARPKSEVCKAKWVTLLIDDHIGNAQDLALAGLSTIILDRPWNRHVEFEHPLVYRVKDWQEIIHHLELYG